MSGSARVVLPRCSVLTRRPRHCKVKTEALHAAVSHGYLRNMPPKAQRDWEESHSHPHTSPAKAKPKPAARVPRKAAASKAKPAPKAEGPKGAKNAKPAPRKAAAPKVVAATVSYGPHKAAEHPSSLIMVRARWSCVGRPAAT